MLAYPTTATRPAAGSPAENRHPTAALAPGQANAAVRLAAGELAEQGWRLGSGGALAGFLLAHPGRGVLLLDVGAVPDRLSDPVNVLAERLRANGFANRHGCLPPLAYRHLSLAEVLALPALVDSLPPGEPPRGEWVAEALAACRAPLPQPRRSLRGLAAAVVLLAVAGAGLWGLAPLSEEVAMHDGVTPMASASGTGGPDEPVMTRAADVLAEPEPVSAALPTLAVVPLPDLPETRPVILASAPRQVGRVATAGPAVADDPRCRAVLLRAQVGDRISDADRDYLRQGCGG